MSDTTIELDQQDILNRFQDQVDAMDAMTKAVRGMKPPIINVQPTPVEVKNENNVEAPKMPAPTVTVEHKPCAWNCEITERDGRGFIKRFKLTPA